LTQIAKVDKRVAIIYESDGPANAASAAVMRKVLPTMGMTLTNYIGVSITATDYTAAATKAIQGSPDGIILNAGGSPLPTLVKTLRTDGYKGSLYGTIGAAATIAAAGAQANGFHYISSWAPGAPGKESVDFARLFAKTSPGITPVSYAVDGYDEVLFLAYAIAKAGSIGHAAVLSGLQQVAREGFEGAGGAIHFSAPDNRQLAKNSIYVSFSNGKSAAVTSPQPSAG
jgi:branched-chain amino acid transport system substrate-binding protein